MTKTNKKSEFEKSLPPKLPRLLRRVQRLIAKHPERFDITSWAGLNVKKTGHLCDTVACIAGHMAFMDLPKEKIALAFSRSLRSGCNLPLANMTADWRTLNTSKLGLYYHFQKLFYVDNWPIRFVSHRRSGNTTTPAKAIKRIDYFLQTGG